MSAAAPSVLAGLASRKIARREVAALLIYLASVIALIGAAAAMLFDLEGADSALEDSRSALARLERPPREPPAIAAPGAGEGSPFLAGATITVAGAALQARVEAATKSARGKMLSSQIDLQGPRAGDGFVDSSETVEISETDLQPWLYDLEAGAPYLFVDSLEVESPRAFGESGGARLRVTIGVTGQWRDKP